jgi:type II secretory pathway pseudopilin PulG
MTPFATVPAGCTIQSLNGGRTRPAFTLIEILLTVALIGALVAVLINTMGPTVTAGVKSSNLAVDVAKLNQMVQLYLADGGVLDTATSEQAVLDHLKLVRPLAEQKTNVGVTTGRLIDVRLRARSVTGPFAYGQRNRAKWNTAIKRFELVSSGSGVDEFYLDDALTEASFPLDSRSTSRVRFNTDKGWIWGSNAADTTFAYVQPGSASATNPSNAFDPTVAIPSGSGSGAGAGAGSGAGAGAGAGSGSGVGSGAGSSPTALPAPAINPVGGTFAYAAFPSTVVITNGGAPGGATSSLFYSVNGGAWQAYSSSVNLNSGDRIEAKNVALVPAYSDSVINAQEYYRLVSSFAGGGAGEWNAVTGGSALKYTITPGDPIASISHGDTKNDLGGVIEDSGMPNTLTYTKNNFSGVSANVPFTLGQLDMLNGRTFNDSEADSVTLTVNLNFTSPPLTRAVDIKFNLINTPNDPLDRLGSADIVELATPSPLSITLDGVTYTLNLQWVTLDPGAGVVQGNKFLIFEGANARAQLRATLASNH